MRNHSWVGWWKLNLFCILYFMYQQFRGTKSDLNCVYRAGSVQKQRSAHADGYRPASCQAVLVTNLFHLKPCNNNTIRFLNALAKLRTAAVSWFMSVCVRPSAYNNSAPSWRIFMKFDIFSIFRKSVEKIQVPLESYKNDRYFTWRSFIHFRSCLSQFFVEWEMFETEIVEKIKTHILYSVTLFRKSGRLWDNVEKIL